MHETGDQARKQRRSSFVRNDDHRLREEAERIEKERRDAGVGELVGALCCIVINVEPDRHRAAVEEILDTTGHTFDRAFDRSLKRVCLLKGPGGVDLAVTSRRQGVNPFLARNAFPRARHLPNTRLETCVFDVSDLDAYVRIQRKRGLEFLTESPIETDTLRFIQTPPSEYTGNSLGFLEWRDKAAGYAFDDGEVLDWTFTKRDWPPTRHAGGIDHIATRVRAEDRDPAILELMRYTGYRFSLAITVDTLNSITNVARREPEDAALVFTSGVSSYINDEASGPTEKFVHRYGPRAHHIAFRADPIEPVFDALKEEGREFLVDLVGGPDQGIHQTFTAPSPHTLLVTEYIRRYGDFDGFFTQHNVTALTLATDDQ